MAIRGRVLRFDPIKGYGFIAPDGGGEDVFLHVNDLVSGDKHQLNPNTVVEYTVEHGDRGAKASDVTIVSSGASNHSGNHTVPTPAEATSANEAVPRPRVDGDDEFVDVVPVNDFSRELTEALLGLNPALTGPQILGVRELFIGRARHYGWVTG